MTETAQKLSVDSIRALFKQYMLEHGHKPENMHLFAKYMNCEEIDIYSYFGSFDAIVRDIWRTMMADTLDEVRQDPSFEASGAKDKLLTFYFSHLENLKRNRSFILLSYALRKPLAGYPDALKQYREEFSAFAREIVSQGIEEGDIADITYLSDQYYNALWIQLLFVLNYWIKDESPDFEKTDAIVEKAVKASFDFAGGHSFSSIIDFGKHIFQNRQG